MSARHIGPRQWDSPYNLSPAEMRVMLPLVEGLTNAEIASRIFVSERAVEKCCAQIYDKMGVQIEHGRSRGSARVAAAVKWVREQESSRERELMAA